jgi:hypothetical protein
VRLPSDSFFGWAELQSELCLGVDSRPVPLRRERAVELRSAGCGAGKPNAEYCRWIQDPQRWGGPIELSILSEHYQREIAAYDIRTGRCDCYGQGRGFTERGMLLYDGLHYDAMAVQSSPGAGEATDITLTPVTGELAGALSLHVACCVCVQAARLCQHSLRRTQPRSAVGLFDATGRRRVL